ncbi:hypothetical protein ACIRG5_25270 [Lentzea sp. NPDC102401]|uniref:hypothetical protein n=1 Tax=Lentzea sp. NPDC102401 TaxID=3364128 RepID=UPI003820EC63
MSALVAVASDGSDLSHARGPLLPELRDLAAALRSLADLDAVVVPVATHGELQLGETLRRLPEEIGAIFLTHTDPVRACAAQRAPDGAGGRLVVTDQDMTAVVLTAAVLTVARRAGTSPGECRVTIIGADLLPGLRRLLATAGFTDVALWSPADHRHDPGRATAVIDLLGSVRLLGRGALIRRGGVSALLALPGLLSAALDADARVIPAEVHLACARGVASVTPSNRLLPCRTDARLVRAVAEAAREALVTSSG